MRGFRQAATALAPGATAGVALMFGGDLIRMLPEAARFVTGPDDVLRALCLLLGLYAITASCVVALVALVWSLAASQPPLEALAALRQQVHDALTGYRGEPERGAWLLAASLAAVVGFGGVYAAVLGLVVRYNTPHLIAVAAAALALLVTAAAVLLAMVVARLLTAWARGPWWRRLVHTRTAVGLWSLGAVAVVVFAVLWEREIFKEIDGWRIYLGVTTLALILAGALATPPRPLAHLDRGGGGRAWLAAGLMVALIILGATWAPRSATARAWLTSAGRDGAVLLGFWRRLADVDGDGASSLWGGGDCAPFDGRISPAAFDIPNNGIDEDCFDGDLRATDTDEGAVTLTHPALPTPRPDVLLFSIDACRRDALGVYGAPPDRSPNIDQFATQAVVFDDVVAPSSWTMPSFAAMMTGRYASELEGYYGAVKARRVPAGLELLPEPLARAGYRTVAVTAGVQLDKLGLDRGFSTWRNLTRTPRGNFAQPVVDAGLEILESQPDGQPLFLWLHVVDLHYPYEAPAKDRLFGTGRRAGYDAELHYVDGAFGVLQRALARSGRDRRLVQIVFADHGEAFMEHGREYHGTTVYAEEVRVPFIVRVPGVAPRRVAELVGAIDLAPTLWDMTGATSTAVQRGLSLAPAILLGRPLAPREILSEQTRYTKELGLTTPGYRLRFDLLGNYLELFDRRLDPGEQHNVAPQHPEVVLELRRKLARMAAPIAIAAGKRLTQVLLDEIPEGYTRIQVGLAQGPEIVAYRVVETRPRQVAFDVIFRARGPMPGKRFQVQQLVRDAEGATLGEARADVTDGVHVPGAWRSGELVLHRGTLSLRRDLKDGSQACVSFLVDKAPATTEVEENPTPCLGPAVPEAASAGTQPHEP